MDRCVGAGAGVGVGVGVEEGGSCGGRRGEEVDQERICGNILW